MDQTYNFANACGRFGWIKLISGAEDAMTSDARELLFAGTPDQLIALISYAGKTFSLLSLLEGRREISKAGVANHDRAFD